MVLVVVRVCVYWRGVGGAWGATKDNKQSEQTNTHKLKKEISGVMTTTMRGWGWRRREKERRTGGGAEDTFQKKKKKTSPANSIILIKV